MSLVRSFLRGSFFLMMGNVLAGILNYGFQVHASSQLSTSLYGELNIWMSFLSLFLFISTSAQIFSNFFHIRIKDLKKYIIIPALILIIAITFFYKNIVNSSHSSEGVGVLAFLLSFGFQLILGQFQTRFWFARMTIVMIFSAIAKLSFTYFFNSHLLITFYFSFIFSYAVGLFCETILLYLEKFLKKKKNDNYIHSKNQFHDSKKFHFSEMKASLLLAFGMTIIPQIDFLNISFHYSIEEIGKFSQASLFSKGLFFGLLTFLQVSLPYSIQAFQGKLENKDLKKLKQFQILGLFFCIISSFLCAWKGPEIFLHFLGFDLRDHRDWIILTCLSLVSLSYHLQKIQVYCTAKKFKVAAVRLGCIVVGLGFCFVFKFHSITYYLIFSVLYTLILQFILRDKHISK